MARKREILTFTPAEEFVPPEPKAYISAEEKMGESCAKEIYAYVYEYLKSSKCERAVSAQLIESYAQMVSRHIQLEKIISETGFLAKHPTTGEPIQTPFIKMSLDYLKMANKIWAKIYATAKEKGVSAPSASEMLENFLRKAK